MYILRLIKLNLDNFDAVYVKSIESFKYFAYAMVDI